jgi:hypothetical protein
MGAYLERLPNYQRRFNDFNTISNALDQYRSKHDAYPVSEGSISNCKQEWIRELVPDYLSPVPRDPRYLQKNESKQYLYIVYSAATYTSALGVFVGLRIIVLWATVFASAHVLYRFIEMPCRRIFKNGLMSCYPVVLESFRKIFS